jgi:hypothetical protein
MNILGRDIQGETKSTTSITLVSSSMLLSLCPWRNMGGTADSRSPPSVVGMKPEIAASRAREISVCSTRKLLQRQPIVVEWSFEQSVSVCRGLPPLTLRIRFWGPGARQSCSHRGYKSRQRLLYPTSKDLEVAPAKHTFGVLTLMAL